MDNVNSTDVLDLGYQPASSIGSQTLLQIAQQWMTSNNLLNFYTPGAISGSNMGSIPASTLGSSTITGVLRVGQTNSPAGIQVDGINDRILVNDGTTNRILIGNIE